MKSLILTLCFLCPLFLHAQELNESVYFESAQHELTVDNSQELEQFLGTLDQHQASYTIKLIGHTDNDGNLIYNQILSEQRCKSIKDYLLQKGFRAQQISFEGKGFANPVAANNNEKGKAQNRRVEMVWSTTTNKPSFHAQVPKVQVKFKAEEGVKFVYERSGTEITIPANILVDKDGQAIKGEVDLSYREFRDVADFIATDISMMHGGGQFHSGGMFEVNAQQKGEQVFIRTGEYMDVDFELTADSIADLSFYQYDGKEWSDFGALDRSSQQNNFDVSYKPCKNRFLPKTPVITDSVQNFLAAMKVGYALSRTNIRQYKEVGFLDADERWADHRYTSLKDYLGYKLNKINLKELSKDHRHYNINFEITGEDDYRIIDFKMQKIRYTQAVSMKIKDYNKSNKELASLMARDWIVLSKGKYRPSDRRNITRVTLKNWADVRVTYDGKTTFKFIVKGYNGFDTLSAQPKLMDKESKKQHQAIAKALYEDYQKILTNEKNLFNQNQQFIRDNWGYFLAFAKSLMHPTEKCMSPYSWLKYFQRKQGVMQKRYGRFVGLTTDSISMQDLSTMARRSAAGTALPRKDINLYSPKSDLSQKLAINGFGVFNCDAIRKLKKPQEVIAYFVDEDNNFIDPRIVNVIDCNINGILKMYDPDKIPFSTVSPTAILVTDYSGDNYFIDAKSFAKLDLKDKTVFTFKLKTISNEVPDVEGLRNTLALSN